MALTDSLQPVAKVLKSNGADGQIVLSVQGLDVADFSALVTRDKVPVFIYFDGLPVPFFVEVAQRRGGSKLLVYLTGIRSGKDVEEIEGCLLYMERTVLGGSEDPMQDFSLLEGWTLCDKGQKVGVILSFEDIPSNPCLQLKDGTLVPFNEELILSVEAEEMCLDMDLPAGLFDL